MSDLEVTTRMVGTAPDADSALVLAVQLAARPEVGETPSTEIAPRWVIPADPAYEGPGELVYEVTVSGMRTESRSET